MLLPFRRVPVGQEVEIHLIPDIKSQILEVRIWSAGNMIQAIHYPLKEFPHVHF